jgi:tetratricopeptide (TPR) repeat protein
MNEPHDSNQTADFSSRSADSLDAGLAAGFGRAEPPRSTLGTMLPVLLKEAKGESADVVMPKSDAMPPPEQAGDRYQLQGEIARGGMGAVLRGRDVDLGRELAVKVLLEKYAHRPDVARRFVEEAQIGGQLQHPGVLPVYDIGRFGERPFFTMKLVKGKTLAALLSERADASLDRPRMLNIALQVCQTLAYAHAKGVIHRDLKPANVMLGAFGEVQVMDWGLAKVLTEGGIADEERANRERLRPEDETTIRTTRSSGTLGTFGTDTQVGSLLGTPAYMPPEQAQGDVVNLDRRADVFGLGAILCEILTGKPPYVGRSSEEIRHRAANGDLADATARLDGSRADQELIALTKRCLEAKAIDRPRDAQEVADGLLAYLNGVQERLQAAERERAVAVVRASEEGKRRKVQLALAAAVVGLLLAGGAFAWWRNEQAQAGRERDARNAEAVATLLGQCEEALRASDAAKAQVALEAARKRSAEGGAEGLAERLGRLTADLALLRDLDAVDQFRWTSVENKFPDAADGAPRTQAALRRFGIDPDAVSADEAAVRVSASAVRERIVTALDRLLWPGKKARARAVLRLVDANPFRDAFRDAVLAREPAKIVELGNQEEALEQQPGFAAFLAEMGDIKAERRRQLLEAGVRRQPGDLGLLILLGNLYRKDQEAGANERLRWFQAALAAAPTNPAAFNNLGVALRDKGLVNEAIACLNKAIELDPQFAGAYANLGAALADKRKVDEAIACFNKAIELDPQLAVAHNGLGAALARKGQVAEAIASLKKAIALDPKAALIPMNLGIVLAGKGQVDEAIACFKQAIQLDPKLAQAHTNLGSALSAKGRLDAAIECYRAAAELTPKDALVQIYLGSTLRRAGQLDKAIACLRKAIELDPKSASAYLELGNALDDKGLIEPAIECYRKAIELDPKFAQNHYNLGHALYRKGQMDQAVACWRKTIELDPNYAEAHCNLGHGLASQGRFAESLAALKRGHELGSKQSDWRYPSAEWLRQATRLAALEAKLPAVLKGELQPKGMVRLEFVTICRAKQFHYAAARLAADALAADPQLANDLQAGHRYNAACSAALAAAGQGKDPAKPDEKECKCLRQQTLTWLRADLAGHTKLWESGPAARSFVRQQLKHWQEDTDLAGIRGEAALAKLPAEERAPFTQLWAEVAALLKKESK